MRARPAVVVLLLFLAATSGCGRNRPGDQPTPALQGPLGTGSSPQTIDSVYAEAEGLFRTGKWRKAMEAFNRVGPVIPGEDPRFLRYRFYLGEIHFALGEYLMASREFRRIADEHAEDPLAPDALFRAGMAHRQLWRKPQLDPTQGQTALLIFAELAGRYPQSGAAARGQAESLALQEWFAEKEFRNAGFYLRYKAYESAILVLRELVASYPRTTIVPQALLAMINAYVALGYEEDRVETCDYVRQFYPSNTLLEKVCPAPPPGSP